MKQELSAQTGFIFSRGFTTSGTPFAVRRLIAWYREGKNVQRLLPHLATYLGHVSIRETSRYLTMTKELLGEASQRFELYANPGGEQ